MSQSHPFPHSIPLLARAAALAIGMLLVTACSPETSQTVNPPGTHAGYPTSHIHGMAVDPGTNRILLATHDGLFDVSASPAQKIGPTIDLMGFTSTPDGTLYASGHPGPGSDLPDPVGLIRSTDQGQSWEALSRQGQSDFHALTATERGLVGYDGELLLSSDGVTWEAAGTQVPAYDLSGTSGNGIVLATTEEGLQRSTDHGTTWAAVPGAPLLMLTVLSESSAAGVTPDGLVYTSNDGGSTWTKQGTVPGDAAAIATHAIDEEALRIWVATEEGVQVSNDSGQTFAPIAPGPR